MATAPIQTSQINIPAELRSKWGWFAGIGILLLILGGIALGNLVIATVASVYFIGMLMLIGGIIEIVHAFGVKDWKSFLFWALSGLLYAAAGIVAFINPILASAVLTFLLAAALIATGLLRAWSGVQSKPATGWGWLVAAGVLTALAGIVIALGWPVNSLWILGAFLAIDLIFQGWAFIAFGLGIRQWNGTVPPAPAKTGTAKAS
ncbi:HdeD family acid-resistance protein [Phyllobacterium salinisoli]|uniref:HdeD family acid-resistance protein n=1 Tax=Phyllobacterium salinisoli TaxID=1899321 RepID=A0A368K866_9HYPH|nr:HdeD family acid-resistance protein [Phyllobacterium salinisoli]RCS24815.1 HdeD family acid-resistance protein [Phyllobacterium salinisoli]